MYYPGSENKGFVFANAKIRFFHDAAHLLHFSILSDREELYLFQMVRRAFNILMPVLLSDMTKDILKSAKVDSDGLMYLDDFLGNNDFDLFNRSKVAVYVHII